jgi:hypothetical protein
MDEANQEVQKSEAAKNADRPEEAAEAARQAAEQLARLAEQVEGLKANELAARLARARDVAQATAKAERELAGKNPENPDEKDKVVADQNALAERAGTLTDLLKQIKTDAAEEDRTLASAVEKAAEANAPGEIESAMRSVSAQVAAGDRENPGKAMTRAAGQLEALARDLESARREFMGPKLQQLLAAERQAAEAQKALESADSEAKKAEAEKAVDGLARALDGLKAGDGPIREAAAKLDEATRQGVGTGGWTRERLADRPGLFRPPILTTNAVRAATKALQAKIQQLILDDALVDRDGAVPPGYEGKVADYFRVLSEDVR